MRRRPEPELIIKRSCDIWSVVDNDNEELRCDSWQAFGLARVTVLTSGAPLRTVTSWRGRDCGRKLSCPVVLHLQRPAATDAFSEFLLVPVFTRSPLIQPRSAS